MSTVQEPIAAPAEEPTSDVGDPTWEIARLFPLQGHWSESEYFALETKQLVELVDGKLEFPPMPTTSHQWLVMFIHRALYIYTEERKLPPPYFAGLPLRLRENLIREPDILWLSGEKEKQRGEQYWGTADFVLEVVSPGGRTRDLVEKKREYAAAGIFEYWIVDPKERTVAVLTLNDGDTEYSESGLYQHGDVAKSVLFQGFEIAVAELFSSDAQA
ncbi:Uma2 family endonuclease [Stratiformator vulcanicus]|uniref:Putative restriction endonuclease domain-containing protein n=1 Tax=Stratiformator vulcanicus TaxID=2527980 RepID=A0A517R6S3_9PLAN|nr:Uma2 family endonuclease [Stratiformator vulcanicus]QDT39597.1 hypothetical protein Pan189_40060 [Stratiformator vulcanicus]